MQVTKPITVEINNEFILIHSILTDTSSYSSKSIFPYPGHLAAFSQALSE